MKRAPALIVLTSLFGLYSQTRASDISSQFSLRTVDGGVKDIRLDRHRATVLAFISMDCPMSMDYGQRAAQLAQEYSSSNVQVFLVAPNSTESDAEIEKVRRALPLAAPIYRDPGALLATQLAVVATPTAVVLDAAGSIRYKGNIDDSRDPAKVRTRFVHEALTAILAGQPVRVPHTRVLGCGIKR